MIQGLAWLGARARWVLALGLVAALPIPGPGALLAGTLPFWVTFLYGLAMTRIDLGAVARRAVGPRRLARNLALCAVFMIAFPAAAWVLATLLGLPDAAIQALVYTCAAPPLGSAAAFCLMLDFDAAFAIEITVLGSLLAPLTMPLVAGWLLGAAIPIEPVEMAGRLALVIGLGSLGAIAARRVIGPDRISRHAAAFDGLSALVLVIFLFPLLDGLTGVIAAAPWFALGMLSLAMLANLGVQIAALAPAQRMAGRATGGAGALMAGNRNAALALASLPPDPLFTLYVALYQVPMYATPLVLRRLAGRG